MDKQRMIPKLAWAAMVAAILVLSSCSAPGNSPAGADTDTNATAPPPATAQPAAPEAPAAVPAAPVAQSSRPIAPLPSPAPTADPTAAPSTPMAGPEGKPGLPPLSLGTDEGRACRIDSDCAMKDAGSCCGYRPVCVNKDTPTFPEKVKAACAKDGRVGICGFPAIDGCQCVAGKCEGAPMMENSVPLQ